LLSFFIPSVKDIPEFHPNDGDKPGDAESGDQTAFKQHNISTAQALAMSDWLLDVDARVIDAIKYGKERGFCAAGDAVIVVTGWRPGYGTTNTLRIIYTD
jgi:pyruvate kinase